MSECRRTAEQLAPYVDGDLAPAERAHVEQHLSDCPPCRRAAEETQGGRTLLRRSSQGLRHEPLPPGLRTRCEALAREHSHPRRSGVWHGRFGPAVAIASMVLLTVAMVFVLASRRSNTLLAQQLTVDHTKCFLLAPHDAPSLDARATEAMLESRYGWNLHVPPSSPAEGILLVGARRCLYTSGTIPHVMYQMGGEDVSLFVLEGVTRQDADVTTLGHRSKIWSNGGTTFVLVSPKTGVDLDRAAQYVMQRVPAR